jgi:putative ABC transport system permease protein
MFKNYCKTTFRFLLKNKTYSFINIFGLAAGTLCCLYILLYVADQYSFDKHHNGAADIYRINTSMKSQGDKPHYIATTSPPVAGAMKNDFAEVLQYTRVVPTLGAGQHLLTYKGRQFYEKEAVYVDSTFFSVFTYHFVNGNADNALKEPYSVVLLESSAKKLFGNEDPVGKIVTIDNAYGKNNFKVTGVVDESLGKSHMQTDMFMAMKSGGFGDFVLNNQSWARQNFVNSYVKLQRGTNAAALEKKLPAFLKKYGEQELKSRGIEKQLRLQNITTIHTANEPEQKGNVSSSFLYILILIAVLIQVIACINFMNLSTARASKRAKEVGVRKVIGAGRKSLVLQFLGESFIMSIIGVLLALGLLALLLPLLNQITQADINLSLLADYKLWLMLAAIIVITGLLAGSYPAFYLSAFLPTKVMKGNVTSHISGVNLRKSLVVFQFVLSIVLISGIIVIYSQLNYIKHKDLGFDTNQQLVFFFHTGDTKSKMGVFITDLRQLPEIKAASKANNYPGSGEAFHDMHVFLAGGDVSSSPDVQNLSTDENFVSSTGIKLVSGRNFRQHDSSRVLINETLAKKLGLNPASAPGTLLHTDDPNQKLEIVGVMKDFNYTSLYNPVNPFMLMYDPTNDDIGNIITAVNSNNYAALLGKIETIWHKNLPAVPFEYNFWMGRCKSSTKRK